MDIKVTVTCEVSTSSHECWQKPPDPFGEGPRREPTDSRQAECPYCKQALKKVPDTKTKCPHCRQPIYVVISPEAYARVVVTQEEATRIKAYWAVAHSAREPDFRYLATKEEVDAERTTLKQRFLSRGQAEPSDDDVKWALLNRRAVEHASARDWGLYRNIRMTMADFLARRMKLQDAVRLYLQVCALDLNGATNSNAHKSPELLAQFPAFNLRQAFTAPKILSQVNLIAGRLGMSEESQQQAFATEYRNIEFGLPLVQEECWDKLWKAINAT